MRDFEEKLQEINEKNCLLAKKYILGYIKGEEIPEDLPFEISGKIYCFKENFLRLVGKTTFNADIRDYGNGVIHYMNNSYPYCLALGGEIERFETLDDAILYYAKSRGATSEQLEQVIPMLKETKMPQVETESFKVRPISESKDVVSVDRIGGSSLQKYKAENLYDALVAVDDKNIQGFIDYLVVNDVFNVFNTGRTMNGIACYLDEDKNLLVAEGNHRVITLKALLAIREFVEGKQIPGPSFKATVVQVEKRYGLN
jgi:hypothetical protein